MKNLNFKLMGVLFIALFCLSPICAADSNATDDTALGDQNYYADLSVSVSDVKKGEPIVIDVYTEDFISQGVYVIYDGGFSFLWLDHGHGQLTPATVSLMVLIRFVSRVRPIQTLTGCLDLQKQYSMFSTKYGLKTEFKSREWKYKLPFIFYLRKLNRIARVNPVV